MSYYLQIGSTGGPTQFASGLGYTNFGKWAESLDGEKYGEIVHLYAYGWCQDLYTLSEQLGTAKNDSSPPDDVPDIIDEMISLLKYRDQAAACCTVTDGTGSDYDEGKSKTKTPRKIIGGYTPDSAVIRETMQEWFKSQRTKALRIVADEDNKSIMIGLKRETFPEPNWAALKDTEWFIEFEQPMIDDIAPKLAAYTHEGAKRLLADAESDSAILDALRGSIDASAREAATKLVQSVLSTTNTALSNAMSDLSSGATKEDVIRAMDPVFDDAETVRAFTIAEAEAKRAMSAGELLAAKSVDTITTKQWINGPAPCDDCVEYADMGPIPLNQSFGDSNYGPIDSTPAHPSCMCSVVFVVDE